MPFNAFAELVASVTKFAAIATLGGLELRTFPKFAVLMLPVFASIFNDIIRRNYSDGGGLKS